MKSTTKQFVFLHGVALANYRGIGHEAAFVGPFERFNFLIGPNNSGKSSVLSFIADYLKPLVCEPADRYSTNPKTLGPLDAHQGATSPVRMGIGIPKSSVHKKLLSGYPDLEGRARFLTVIDSILAKVVQGELLWLERKPGQQELQAMTQNVSPDLLKDLADNRTWNEVWSFLTRRINGGLIEHWIPETVRVILNQAEVNLPKVNLIPAIRKISARGSEFTDWSGTGLIEELARLQNPGVHERNHLEKFRRINEFLKSVTENDSALIEIPHDREHILVHMNNKVLPLESLGTGIHEVVMLAAFCTLMEQEIVCIEEPEIHLHPLLQRRLIQFLEEKTDNQYFIATHSPSLIDKTDAAVFHVTNPNGQTKITAAMTSSTRFDICRDLGYKASDLLQSNAIIWVEGPSDRIYIRHWISLVAPELMEGIDYSIMFYGGRLLSHLTADELDDADEDIKALIAVRQLNRNLAVVIDSDRASADAEVNKTKARVLSELDMHGGVGWLTAGREIENYVPVEAMSEVLEAIYQGKYAKRLKSGQYDHVLPFKTVDGPTFKDVDKVKMAREVCKRIKDLNVLDLESRIRSLVQLIRSSNL